MKTRLYNRFIRPLSDDSDLAEREIVLNYLLVGIILLSVVAFIITLLGPLLSSEPSYPNRLLGNLATTLLLVGLYSVARYGRQYRPVAVFVTLLIALFGCFIASQWGLLDPYSALLLSLAVVMAGILVGSRYSIYVTCGLVLVLSYLQHGQASGTFHPDTSWKDVAPAFGDVIGISAILFAVAFVSWLFNRQMELSLRRARRSEKALKKQKSLLEVKVQQRTQQLEAARLEQMGELYRFAELGRLSTALFHDLANHLTNITVDMEGIKAKDESDIINRMQDNVRHIDSVVQRVRRQLQGRSSIETFNVMDEINEVVDILTYETGQAGISIMLEPGNVRPSLSYKGDVTRFRQIILNVVANAIEAYGKRSRGNKERQVAIRLSRSGTELLIDVTDFGTTIPAPKLGKIFDPFYTTKPGGMGIGLFIVKQVVENDFDGSISVISDKRQGTTFSIRLPKSYYVKNSGT